MEQPRQQQGGPRDRYRYRHTDARHLATTDVLERLPEPVRHLAIADDEHESAHGGVEAEGDDDRRERELRGQRTLHCADACSDGDRDEHADRRVATLLVEVEAHHGAGQPGGRPDGEIDVAAQEQQTERRGDDGHGRDLHEHQLDVAGGHEVLGLRPEEQDLRGEGDHDALVQEPGRQSPARRLWFDADAAERALRGVGIVSSNVRLLSQ